MGHKQSFLAKPILSVERLLWGRAPAHSFDVGSRFGEYNESRNTRKPSR